MTKEDHEALHSPGHPDLSDEIPQTECTISSRKRKAREKGKGLKKKQTKRSQRLSIYDVSQVVQNKGITSRLQLVCLAVEQNREGKCSLAQFIANRGTKAVDEAIEVAKEFSQAEALYLRANKTHSVVTGRKCSRMCCWLWGQVVRSGRSTIANAQHPKRRIL